MDPRTARALGTGTRASIYKRLVELGEPRTVADIADEFNLHPNVARAHLEKLAELGLATVGQRKHPGGGRPAKLYEAADPLATPAEPAAPASADDPAVSLLVRLLAELAERPPASRSGPPHPLARAHEVAAAEGARLVGGAAGERRGERGDAGSGDFDAGVDEVVAALGIAMPSVRVAGRQDGAVDVDGIDGAFRVLATTRPRLARALERGLLSGALAAVGAPASIAEVPGVPGRLRVRPTATTTATKPAGRVDARGGSHERGVAEVKRVLADLQPGEVIEVLAAGPGAPAAFARWADRAGHQLLSVERAVDEQGRAAIRLLLRNGG